METETKTKKSALNRIVYKILNEYLVVVGIILFAVFTMIMEPNFMTVSNMGNLMRQFGPLAFVSLGMTFIILAGYIDLSIAGMFSLVSAVSISQANQYGAGRAILVGLLIGLAAGLINSLLLLLFGVQNSAGALFITYGMSLIYGALALMYSNGATIHLKDGVSGLEALGKGAVGIVPISFILFLALLALLFFLQSKTYIGRSVSYTGGNPVASRLSGIPVKRVTLLIFSLCGLMTAVGAIVLFSRVTSSGPTEGTGYDTNSIMAVVIGGTSLKGGKGNVLRTVVGVAVVTLMSNCLNLLGVSSYMQDFTKGIIMILAIWLDNRSGMMGGAAVED